MKRRLLLACFVLAIVLLAAGGWAVEAFRGSKTLSAGLHLQPKGD